MKNVRVVTAEDREPHGLACMDCSEPMLEGDVYVQRLEGMIGGVPVVEAVCWNCGDKS